MAAVMLSCSADAMKLTYVGDAGMMDSGEQGAEQLLRGHLDVFLEALLLCTACVDGQVPKEDTLMHPVLDVPETDAAALDLQSQVLDAAHRIARLRASAPVLISTELSRCLDTGGRGAAALDVLLPARGVCASGSPPAQSPAPAELQGRIVAVVARMSSMRARVEEALERLQRVIGAVEDEARQGPPCTVERALRGSVPRPAAGAAGGQPSPMLGRAVESGRISTRRRAAKDLQPLPFPLP